MATYSFSSLLFGVSLLALTACTNPAEAVPGTSGPPGIDLGPSSRVQAAVVVADASDAARRSADVRLVHDGRAEAHAVGVVNAVEPAQHKINLTHEPIQSIGWPSMTMEFPVAPSVDLTGVKPGSRVDFTLEKGKNGMYEIQSVQPVGAKR
jgi:Cu(I)/Ag(I) efflux system protein CusF